jgi:hypothetical protein
MALPFRASEGWASGFSVDLRLHPRTRGELRSAMTTAKRRGELAPELPRPLSFCNRSMAGTRDAEELDFGQGSCQRCFRCPE